MRMESGINAINRTLNSLIYHLTLLRIDIDMCVSSNSVISYTCMS